MSSNKKIYDLSNEEDMKQIHKQLFEVDIESDSDTETLSVHYEVEEEVSDAGEEVIEERIGDSETEQSGEDISSDEETGDQFFSGIRMRGKRIKTYEWKKTPYTAGRRTARHNLLTRLPGVKGPAKDIKDIYSTWKCLFTDGIIEMLVKYTNQFIDTIKDNFARPRDANYTDRAEIQAFIGLLYIAGTHKAGGLNLQTLWNSEGFGVEIFRLTMSRTRFLLLFRCLRFDDRNTRSERILSDRLAPVRDLLEQFLTNCQACYSLSAYVTLDEKLEAFRGRCSFIQYMPSKPAKYGLKIFALTDAKVYYTSNLEVYAGKQPEGPHFVSNKCVDVVERMIEPIRNTGRNVTADNWFSDITLLKTLSENHRLSFVGTLKKNKWQIPPELKTLKNREVFSSIFAYRKEGTLVSYVPKNKNKMRNVLVISSMHFEGAIDQNTGPKKKPEAITFYNKIKIGVDILDKMCSSYNVSRNTKRWPMVVLFSLLNIAGINSQVIYLGNGNDVPVRREFLEQLGRGLLEEQLQKRRQISSLPPLMLGRLKEIAPSQTLDSQGQSVISRPSVADTSSRKRCAPCQKQQKRYTQYKCQKCGQYLCLGDHCSFVCAEGCVTEEPKDD